jgi:hypothetical protein
MSYKVSPKRHLAKTVSYRIISTLIGFLALWWATGDIKFGTAFGFMELIFKPFLYYAHERAWYKWFKFGLIEEKKPKLKKVQLNEVQTISEEPTNLNEPTKKKVLSYSSNR